MQIWQPLHWCKDTRTYSGQIRSIQHVFHFQEADLWFYHKGIISVADLQIATITTETFNNMNLFLRICHFWKTSGVDCNRNSDAFHHSPNQWVAWPPLLVFLHLVESRAATRISQRPRWRSEIGKYCRKKLKIAAFLSNLLKIMMYRLWGHY